MSEHTEEELRRIGNDNSKPDPIKEPVLSKLVAFDEVAAKLNKHFGDKRFEARRKFGPFRGETIVKQAKFILNGFGEEDLTREEVRFIQDWINETGELLKPEEPKSEG